MKLDSQIKLTLYFYLRQLEIKNGNKTVIEILKIILDENKTFDDVKKEIPRLQAFFNPAQLNSRSGNEPSGG